MTCNHTEDDVAEFADGLCPLCLQDENELLRTALNKILNDENLDFEQSDSDLGKEAVVAWGRMRKIASDALTT